MKTRLLKRNVSLDATKEPPKKPRLRKPLDTRYETPYPSGLGSDSLYKLPSSVGSVESPSKFSPIPSARRPHRRTSSTNLKENVLVPQNSPFPQSKPRQHRIKKYGKSSKRRPLTLESPFNSCSSSPSSTSSPDSCQDIHTLTHSSRIVSHSTASSPVPGSPTRVRRPSVPTPPRISSWNYISSHTVSAVDLHAAPSNNPESRIDTSPNAFYPVVRPSPNHSQMDFNRPPSQLSLYDYNCSGTLDSMAVDGADNEDPFFADVRGTSTPFNHLGSLGATERRFGGTVDPSALSASSRILSSTALCPDTDTDSDPDGCSDEDADATRPFQLLQLAWKKKSKARSGYITPAEDSDEEMRPRSPWINDSLISPPKTCEWNLIQGNPEDSAYKKVNAEESSDDMEVDEDQRLPEPILERLLDNLMIDETICSVADDPENQCTWLPLRTRSMDTALPSSASELQPAIPAAPLPRRTRSGTIVPGVSSSTAIAAPTVLSRRTRSGTVVPSNFGSFGSTSTDNSDRNAGGRGSYAPAPRSRSGSVISGASSLAPSLPIVEERSSAGATSIRRAGSIVLPAPVPEGAAATSSRTRIRSGSIVSQVGNTLAQFPSQAAGMMRRSRSGTVVQVARAPPAPIVEPSANTAEARQTAQDPLTIPQDQDIEIAPSKSPLSNRNRSSLGPVFSGPKQDEEDEDGGDDPLNIFDGPMTLSDPRYHGSPMGSLDLATDTNTASNARSSNGFRAHAKAAASKAKELSKALASKGGTKGKGILTGAEAGAAALARFKVRTAEEKWHDDDDKDDFSDDELLLK
ncbi:hypothetical protein D9757_007511 [Collybiopsis confluens]|uniref:Uncharacterized protein n=1 Tax=Collybiopsis confluens TaxID=2823264 RepID=A0A8H5HJR9_9AGAR|nr:hypothetical protein D9757_007511 [Collybiopsis confluens]